MLSFIDKRILTTLVWVGPFVAALWLGLSKPYLIGTFLWFLIPLIMMVVIELIIWSYPGEAIPRSHWLYNVLYGLRLDQPRYIDFLRIPEDFFIALFLYVVLVVTLLIGYVFGFLVCKKPDLKLKTRNLLTPYENWPLKIKGVRIQPIWFLAAYGVSWLVYTSIPTMVEIYNYIGSVNLMTSAAIIFLLVWIAIEYKTSQFVSRLKESAVMLVTTFRQKICLRKPVE